MNFQKYNELGMYLQLASEKKMSHKDYSKELKKACDVINEYVANSDNKIKTAWEIERTCLVYDRDCSIDKDRTKLNSRFTGCSAALKDYKELNNQPKAFVKDFITFQPYDIDAKTTFTKEAFNTLKYLGTEKNATSTTMQGRMFYELRQDIIKTAEKEYQTEKVRALEKYMPKSLQKDHTNDGKGKGRER